MQSSVVWKPWLFALLAALIGLTGAQLVERFQRQQMVDHERQHVANELAGLRARLEGEINGNLLMVRGLSAVIAADPDLDQVRFARIASGMLGGRSFMRNIAGAPDLVIRFMHPMVGNEAAIGLDYRAHPEQREAALHAAETGDIVVAGPLELVQGGVALIARQPVYPVPEPSGGPRSQWGLVSAAIDIDKLYENAGVAALAESAQLTLAIRGRNGTGAAGNVSYGDAVAFDQTPVLSPVSLPSGSWEIAALPRDGWESHLHTEEITATRIIGIVISVLFAFLAYTVAAKNHQLYRTAAQLRDSETLFSGFLNNVPAGAFVKDPGTGRLLFENRWLKAHPADAERLGGPDNDLATLREGPQMLRGEIETPKGAQMAFETLRFALGGKSNQDLVGGVVMDISERVRAERALADSEERLRLALEAANQGLYDLDLVTGEALVSPEYARMLGYDPDTFHETQEVWRARLHPDDSEPVRRAFEDYIAGRIPEYRVEFRQRTRDGNWCWILSHGKIQARDADGRPRRMLGTHTDIQALKQAQAEVADRNRRLVEAEAQAHMGHWWLDKDMQRAWWADEVYRILGLPLSQNADLKTLGRCVDVDAWPSVQHSLREAMAGRQEHNMEYRVARPDGQTRHVRCRAQRVVDEDSGQVRLSGTFQDITPLREVQLALEKARDELEDRVEQRTRELRQANQELETFTYSVSHDLKAPLRGIDGYSRLLLEDHADQLDDEGKLFLNNVRRGVDTMTQLIEDLLSYSRLERRRVERVSISIEDLIDAVIAERRNDIGAAGAGLVVDVEPIDIEADTDGLRLALRNLLDNALKFTEKTRTPRIRISAHAKRQGGELSVIDNGIGFDMRFHDRIFDIFQRLHRSEDYPGTGIGLAIVRKAMQRIGGSVRANSDPGKGANFVLDIPQ